MTSGVGMLKSPCLAFQAGSALSAFECEVGGISELLSVMFFSGEGSSALDRARISDVKQGYVGRTAAFLCDVIVVYAVVDEEANC